MQALSKRDVANLVLAYLQGLPSAHHEFCKNSPYLKEEWKAVKEGVVIENLLPPIQTILGDYVETRGIVSKVLQDKGIPTEGTLREKVMSLINMLAMMEPSKRKRSSLDNCRGSKRFRGEDDAYYFLQSTVIDEQQDDQENTANESIASSLVETSDIHKSMIDLESEVLETPNQRNSGSQRVLRHRNRQSYNTSTVCASKATAKKTEDVVPKPESKKAEVISNIVLKGPDSTEGNLQNLSLQDYVFQTSQVIQEPQFLNPHSFPLIFIDNRDGTSFQLPEGTIIEMPVVQSETVQSNPSTTPNHVRSLRFRTPTKITDPSGNISILKRVPEGTPLRPLITEELNKSKNVEETDKLQVDLEEWRKIRSASKQPWDEHLRAENRKIDTEKVQKVKRKYVRKKPTVTRAKARMKNKKTFKENDDVEQEKEEEKVVEKTEQTRPDAESVVIQKESEKIFFKVTPRKSATKPRPTLPLTSQSLKASPEAATMSHSMIQAASALENNIASGPTSPIIMPSGFNPAHDNVELDAALSLSSLYESTPLKLVSPTPNAIASSSSVNTPVVAGFSSLASLIKDAMMPTPNIALLPKTPGQELLNSCVKGSDGYSSAASSYYQPDDLPDKQLEDQIRAEAVKTSAQKLTDYHSSQEKSEPDVPNTPTHDNLSILFRKPAVSRIDLDDVEERARQVAELEEKKARTITILKRQTQVRVTKTKQTKFLQKLPTPPSKLVKKKAVSKKLVPAKKVPLKKTSRIPKPKEVEKTELTRELRTRSGTCKVVLSQLKLSVEEKDEDENSTLKRSDKRKLRAPKKCDTPKKSETPKKAEAPPESLNDTSEEPNKLDETKYPSYIPEESTAKPVLHEQQPDLPIPDLSRDSTLVADQTLVPTDLSSSQNYTKDKQEDGEASESDEDGVVFTFSENKNIFCFSFDEANGNVDPPPAAPIKFKPYRYAIEDQDVVLRVNEAFNLFEKRPDIGSGSGRRSGSFKETPRVRDTEKTSRFEKMAKSASPPKYKDFLSQANTSPSVASSDSVVPRINIKSKTKGETDKLEKGKTRQPQKPTAEKETELKSPRSSRKLEPDDMIAAVLHKVHGR